MAVDYTLRDARAIAEDAGEAPELSSYALTATQRRWLRWLTALSVAAAVGLSVVDALTHIRLVIPSLLFMSVANVCGVSLVFAKRFMPVHEAFRLGYKAGRNDERRSWIGEL